jgi:hypothetical protein
MFAGFEKAVVAHAGREEAAEFPRLRRVVGPVASLVDRARDAVKAAMPG